MLEDVDLNSLGFCRACKCLKTAQDGPASRASAHPFHAVLESGPIQKIHTEGPRGCAYGVRVSAGHSSWVLSKWELEHSDCWSASAPDLSCSESCSLLGMEFFFGRPFGLVGDSRPPPCNTCRLNISRKIRFKFNYRPSYKIPLVSDYHSSSHQQT